MSNLNLYRQAVTVLAPILYRLQMGRCDVAVDTKEVETFRLDVFETLRACELQLNKMGYCVRYVIPPHFGQV